MTPHIAWYDLPPRGYCITIGLGYLCISAPPPQAHLIGASLLIPAPWGGDIQRESSRASLTAQLRPPWFWYGTLHHPLHSTSTQGTAWTSLGPWWTCQNWSSIRRSSFQPSEWRRSSAVLWNSCPYSLWRIDVSVPIVDQHWRRRSDNVLVLATMINHPSQPMFLTCCVVFDQSALWTSKKLVIVVIISQSENSEF